VATKDADRKSKQGGKASALPVTIVPIADLKPHPKNYRTHPPEQLKHIAASITANGFYRNVVVAKDLTILAGHGSVDAAKLAGLTEVPVVRLDLAPNDRRALKVLAGDNEIGKLSDGDDRALTEMLREIMGGDPAELLGTGYDDKMLANLVLITRPASEIADFDAAAEWTGMPEYEVGGRPIQLVISFRSKEDRDAFAEKLGVRLTEKMRGIWWPQEDRIDAASVHFEQAPDGPK
jgi:ParB-like nuclease family protein